MVARAMAVSHAAGGSVDPGDGSTAEAGTHPVADHSLPPGAMLVGLPRRDADRGCSTMGTVRSSHAAGRVVVV